MIQSTETIVYRNIPYQLVAYLRTAANSREEIGDTISLLLNSIPKSNILGQVICTYNFISTVPKKFDVEVSIPIKQIINHHWIKTKKLLEYECFSIIHKGDIKKISESLRKVFDYAYGLGINSDEFYREIFLDRNNPQGRKIEVQFIIHNWEQKFLQNVRKFQEDIPSIEKILASTPLTFKSNHEQRFKWINQHLKHLHSISSSQQEYEILSQCAHVFPINLIHELRTIYETALDSYSDPSQAIDKTLEYMRKNKSYGNPPIRKNNLLIATKNPRNPEAFKQATTREEKISAYCYCAIIRNSPPQEMIPEFCKCSAGWFRQQWEGILGQKVRIEVLKSLLLGDDECQFAIHLPLHL